MKSTFSILIICIFFLLSCVERGKPEQKTQEIKDETSTKTEKKVVYHYTCSKGHKGSDDAGVCPECSTPYLHNQAYHATQSFSIPPPVPLDPSTRNAAPANAVPPPAQNAKGVYHYICSNAQHTEGAGVAGNCKVCDTKLAHNQAYHQ